MDLLQEKQKILLESPPPVEEITVAGTIENDKFIGDPIEEIYLVIMEGNNEKEVAGGGLDKFWAKDKVKEYRKKK